MALQKTKAIYCNSTIFLLYFKIMKVIIHKTGEIKEVKNGYARNYLIPQNLAILATELAIQDLEREKSKLKKQAEVFSKKVISMKLEVGDKGKAFGSITSADIAEKLKINKKQVLLEKPIKKAGEYKIAINLGQLKPKLLLRVSAKNQKA